MPAPPPPTGDFDERFYHLLQTLVGINIGSRVYHVEIIQAAADGLTKYPALVYELESDASINEIDGTSGVRQASFNVMIFARSITDCRNHAAALDAVNCSDAQATFYGYNWITILDVTDEYEVPFDYDEKAMKYTALNITILYPSSLL